ncbi:MAG: polyprenyl synthetase family protein [Firmicutes bacterium]|jgi:octaprenyl-diphosphate synthase|nr:polyprenyl synthetase family protein [Bacillota bacterium]HPU01872.1 polyprenyl synthetase family protein [Bacillota bacterium]HPZ65672.1 polyprenyl synthetase family protein [Bacillota bacterium]
MHGEVPGLSEVDRAIRKALYPAPGRLGEIIGRILENRGKMLRPRLLLTCTALAGCGKNLRSNLLFDAAAAVELIHTASLIHDDIIDEAARRRNQETLHLRWGPGRAALVGDLLLARAFALLSRPGGSRKLLHLLARTVAHLCRGEIYQMEQRYRWELTEKQYYRINYYKTACFIASCCEAGGLLAGASAAFCRALRNYGLKLGQAFQIVDDILDYAGYPERLGKPVGNDLEQGRTTLPLIHLFETQKQYLKLVRMLPANTAPPRELQKMLREAVKKNGSLDYALAAARRKQAEAVAALQHLPEREERQALAQIAEELTRHFAGTLGGQPVDPEIKLS